MNKKLKYQLIVVADTNDADYVTQMTDVSLETVEELRPLLSAIAKNDGQWCTSEYENIEYSGPIAVYGKEFTEELVEKFNGMVPYGENGVHTIETIKLIQYCDVETFI